MIRARLMEKIMSKSNDSSKLVRTPQVRELRDDELEEVSGGYTFNNVMVESIVAPRDFNSGHTVGLVAPLMPQFDE
jgi:hypothetical protein